ncbi:MAG: O-antigen ligase family protein [Syntrophomonadaceae bacterium]|nr:O-antigen ligase family protein [Syntrophomonadaceae bacterium]
MTEALGFIAVFFLIWAIYKESMPLMAGISLETALWVVFALTSLFTGYFIMSDQTQLVLSVLQFSINLVLIIALCFISRFDGNIDYIVAVQLFLAFLCAITTVIWGQPFTGSNQISMTAAMNPNVLGLLMVFGIFCLLYKLDISKRSSVLFVLAGTSLFFYTIILTASKKSFLAACFLLIYWLLVVFGRLIRDVPVNRKILAITMLLVAVLSYGLYLTPIFQDSVIVDRLTTISAGDETRIGMYQEAYGYFKSSPLVGIGFDNYRFLSVYGTYSHSTYAEVLACTGILGAFIYLSAYLIMAVKLIRISMDSGIADSIHLQARNILGFLAVLLALGAGVILFYEMNSSMVLAAIIAFNQINHPFRP